MTTSRRAFVCGSAAAVGGLIIVDKQRFLSPVADPATQIEGEAEAPGSTLTGPVAIYRTGHSNNCDGACGHLVHVVDGRVTMIGPAPWGTKGRARPDVPSEDLRPRPVPDLQHLQPGPGQVPV